MRQFRCVFGLALGETLVADERALPVANKAAKRHEVRPERPVREVTVYLAHRNETW